MRIVKVTGGYPPAFQQGGTATAAHSLCKALKSLGHSTKVLTTNIDGSAFLPWGDQWRPYDGIDVFYARASRKYLPYYCPALVRELRRLLYAADIVLLDSSWTWYGPKVGAQCRRMGVPYVVYAHGCLAPGRVRRGYWKKRLWWRLFDADLYNKASAVVALTEKEAHDLRRFGVSRPLIEVIPNGVDPIPRLDAPGHHLRSIGIDPDRPIVLFLGRIEPIKGVDVLIRAFRLICDHTPDPLLVIAGPDEDGERQKTERLSHAIGLGDRVVFTGPVYGETKWALLHSATVFVLPSVEEGLPMAVLEALECGVPVVISEGCGLREVAASKAGFVVSRDFREIATSVLCLLRDRQLRSEMGLNGRGLVESKYRWRRVAEQTIDLCRRIM